MYLMTKVDYTINRGRPVILVRYRDENNNAGTFKLTNFRPYFYAPANEVSHDKKSGEYLRAIDGTIVEKVYTKLPSDVPRERGMYTRSYEADVLFPVRFMIDRGLRSGFTLENNEMKPVDVSTDEIKVTKLYVDIETQSPDGACDPNIADDRILTIGTTYIDENEGISEDRMFHDVDESIMLKEFIQYVKDVNPDMLLAWFGYFDFATIYNRCKKMGVDGDELSPYKYIKMVSYGRKEYFKCSGRIVVDLMEAYDNYYKNQNLDSLRLEDVAENECGIKQSNFDYSKLGNWKKHINEIKKYNRLDVQRMVELDKKIGIIEHFDILRRIIGCPIDYCFQTSKFGDVLMLREYNGDFACPTKGEKDYEHKKFEGGYVHTPVPGIYEWVAMLDFGAMYPTIIQSYNISPETIAPDSYDGPTHDISINGDLVRFKKEPRGKLPNIFDSLTEYRDETKKERDSQPKESDLWTYYDKKQYGLKQVIASLYGFFGLKSGRFYNPKVPASITSKGRQHIKETAAMMEKQGHKLVYSDTDSVMLELDVDNKNDAVNVGLTMEDMINDRFKQEAKRDKLNKIPNIEMEKVYRRMIFGRKKGEQRGAKKRYAGLKIWEQGKWCDEIGITGFDAVRSDQSKLTKEAQQELFDIILREGNFNKIHQFINNLEYDVKRSDSLQDFAQIKSVRKDPEDYAVPMAVQGLIWANRNLDKEFGINNTKPYIIYIKRMPSEYEPTINVPKKRGQGLPNEERLVKRVALDDDCDFNLWKPYVDFDKHIDKQIKSKFEPILNSIGYTYEEVKKGHTQTSLGDY